MTHFPGVDAKAPAYEMLCAVFFRKRSCMEMQLPARPATRSCFGNVDLGLTPQCPRVTPSEKEG